MRLRVLPILLLFIPALAVAQRAPSPPALASSYDLVAPNGVVHVEEFDVDGHRQLHCVITSNEGDAELTYDGLAIQFGDGCAIRFTTLARTPAAFVLRLVAVAPHGPSSTAIVARSLSTGETTHAGFEGFSATMRRSRQAQIAAGVLAALQNAPAEGRKLRMDPLGRPPFVAAPQDCLTSAISFVMAAAGVLYYCGDPATALQCIGSISTLGMMGYNMWKDCTDGGYLDECIGCGP